MGGLSPAAAPLGASDARAVLARHGRSFHWASRMLGAIEAERAAELYAFCRLLDDVVDLEPAASARRTLERVRKDLVAGFSDDPNVERFVALALETGIEVEVAESFLDGLATTSRIRHIMSPTVPATP